MKTERQDVVARIPEKTRDLTPFEAMDRLFDTFFHRGWLQPWHEIWPEARLFGEPFDLRTPRMDLIDREDAFLVRAELPGVTKEDLSVDLAGQTLTIKGEHRREDKETQGEFYRAEISRGRFSRSIHLPEEVEDKDIKAEFENGVLEIRLPKLHKVERRTIKVK